jgi:type III secretion system low calcium response chaperone LcrH/SycD
MMAENQNAGAPDLDAILDALGKGATLGDAAGLTQNALEAGYGMAFNLYNAGNYADAEKLFSALCVYDHHDERFWNGLGGCRQANGHLEGAIDAYNMATVAGALGNPAPSVHAGLCYLKLGDTENASALFNAAIELGQPDNSEHQAYRERARAMFDLIAQRKPTGVAP